MKPNELRIGNYYRAGLEIIGSREAKLNLMDNDRVIQLRIEHFQVFQNAPIIVEMINPIPLTEEWLVKFGFKKTGETKKENPIFTYMGAECKFQLEQIGDSFYLMANNSYSPSLKYVHKLQNLYYALTETELAVTAKNNVA